MSKCLRKTNSIISVTNLIGVSAREIKSWAVCSIKKNLQFLFCYGSQTQTVRKYYQREETSQKTHSDYIDLDHKYYMTNS